MHVVAAKAAALYVPAVHSTHDVAASESASTYPARQSVQAVAPALEYLPAAQFVHAVSARESWSNLPCAQLTQSLV